MIPRSILRPIHQLHKRFQTLVLLFGLACLCILVMLSYIVYSAVNKEDFALNTSSLSTVENITLPAQPAYDFDTIRSMYNVMAKKKEFIGSGLYVVLWDKTHHRFYDALTQNVDEPYNAASMTKLVTALTLAQEGALPSKLIDGGLLSDFIGLPEGEAAGDFRGQVFPQSDLLAAMLIQSSNQAAYSLVKPIGSDVFAEKANKAARRLGMSRSVIRDPSGYDFGSKKKASYMSPRDVARVGFELVSQFPDVVKLSSHSTFDIKNTKGKKFALHNTNPLVEKFDNVWMSKTGYTNLAGGNLTMVTEPRPNILVAYVTMHSTKEGRFSDMDTMVGMMNDVFDMYDIANK